MIQTITQSDFHDAFRNYNRLDNFSYEARELLFEYFDECEAGTGEPIGLDVIAICCEYYENDLETVISEYRINTEGCENLDDRIELVREYLGENTTLVGETPTGFVYAAF
jgi:hypothetical protein